MAKKIKQKKAGMLKRKQQKRKQKEQQRRVHSSRGVKTAQNSQRYLEGLFHELPCFAFDERFDDLRLNAEHLKQLHEDGEADPLILMKLITPEFLLDLEQRLVIMEESTAPRSKENMLAKACLHQIERSHEIPHLSNPMIVAVYLRTRAEVQEKSLDVSGIHQAIEDYEEENKELIDRLSEDPELLAETIQSHSPQAAEATKEDAEEEIEDAVLVSNPLAIPVELLEEYRETYADLSEEEQEIIEDNLEVFLVDFDADSYETWNAPLIQSFLEDWCIKNLNPLEEDLWSMQETILHFLRFMAQKELISEPFSSEIFPRLEDREACKALFQN